MILILKLIIIIFLSDFVFEQEADHHNPVLPSPSLSASGCSASYSQPSHEPSNLSDFSLSESQVTNVSTLDLESSPVTHMPPCDIAQNKGESPRQPTGIRFPSRAYGSTNRSFQAQWYQEYEWLEYSIERDAAFCFPCRFFGVAPDHTFTSTGFRDWKHARGKSGILTSHGNSCHKHHQAVLSWKEYRSSVVNNSSISIQLERGRLRAIEDNSICQINS